MRRLFLATWLLYRRYACLPLTLLGIWLVCPMLSIHAAPAPPAALPAWTRDDLVVNFGPDLDAEEERLQLLLNDERKSRRISRLTLSPHLCQAAAWLAVDMAEKGYLDHEDSQKRIPQARMAAFGYTYDVPKAEIVASGPAIAQVILAGWQQSAAHNANLLNPDFRACGIGRAHALTGERRWYWVLLLGAHDDRGTPFHSLPDYQGRTVKASSYTGSLAALCDTLAPGSSREATIPHFIWTTRKNPDDWVEYAFDSPRTLTGVDIYWYVNRAGNGRCDLPQSWRVLYKDAGGQWKPVSATSPPAPVAGRFNTLTFAPLTTRGLCMKVLMQPGLTAGLLEWGVIEAQQPRACWLDALDLTPMSCGLGQPQRGKAITGTPMLMRGIPFTHGIGTHASSTMSINLRGTARRFEALVGMDDSVPRDWKGIFTVTLYGDGKELAACANVSRSKLPRRLAADLTGVQYLTLEVSDGQDGTKWDYANLAHARLFLDPGAALPQLEPLRIQSGDRAVTASHIADQLHAVSDGAEPDLSTDSTIPRFTWGTHRGTTEWVQYTFKAPATFSGCEVFWYTDAGSVGLPAAWRVLYLTEAGSWSAVTPLHDYPREKDQYNYIAFTPVKTTALRLEATLAAGHTAGILEWKTEEEAKERTIWLESLDFATMTCGSGRPQRARSLDRRPLSLWGKKYTHGIGTHAVSIMRIDLKGAAARFKAVVGLDDELPPTQQNCVRFTVWGDGRILADSEPLYRGSMPVTFSVGLKHVRYLTLPVEDGGDGTTWDHADWANAHLIMNPSAKERPVALPPRSTCPMIMANDRTIAFSSGTTSTLPLCDGRAPRTAGDRSLPSLTWRPQKGTKEWAEYIFPEARTLSRCAVYWVDSPIDCRVPASWQLFYLDGENWKPVAAHGAYGLTPVVANTVAFDPVTTKRLRLEVQLQPDATAGLYEWAIE
jgi:uncharacterized protein YkwD